MLRFLGRSKTSEDEEGGSSAPVRERLLGEEPTGTDRFFVIKQRKFSRLPGKYFTRRLSKLTELNSTSRNERLCVNI